MWLELGKIPTVQSLGRQRFYCLKERKPYDDLEVLERRDNGKTDLLVAKDPQGHEVFKIARKQG